MRAGIQPENSHRIRNMFREKDKDENGELDESDFTAGDPWWQMVSLPPMRHLPCQKGRCAGTATAPRSKGGVRALPCTLLFLHFSLQRGGVAAGQESRRTWAKW